MLMMESTCCKEPPFARASTASHTSVSSFRDEQDAMASIRAIAYNILLCFMPPLISLLQELVHIKTGYSCYLVLMIYVHFILVELQFDADVPIRVNQ